MREEAALLAAIRADPDDDTPRLVYADWLQEHGGEARAEFIRLQIADPVPDGARPTDFPARQKHLWSLWYAAWLKGGGSEWIGSRVDCFRRGFIDRVHCPAAVWVTYGDMTLEAHPVRAVVLWDAPGLVGEEDDIGLAGDPRGKRFAWDDVTAVAQRLTLSPSDPTQISRVVCEFRWPGIAFTLPRVWICI